ncbi:pseudouridine synthase [Chytridium lagenaria]|nr:pseudouridine synthase [Chytridium lagenaria]
MAMILSTIVPLQLKSSFTTQTTLHYVRIDGPTEKSPTIESMLQQAYPEQDKFRLVHQLDFVTSGIHVWGLNRHSARRACSQFSQRTVKKTYNAIVEGHVALDEFEVEKNLADMVDDPHKRICIGTPDNLGRSKPVSLLEISPITGRRHQIRVHLLSIGHPIIGDYLYQDVFMEDAPRTMLHARHIFIPLTTGDISIDSGDALSQYLDDMEPRTEA